MLKKYCIITMVLVFVMITQNSFSTNTDNLTRSPLLEVTDEIRAYAYDTVRPKISDIQQKDLLAQFLGIVEILLDPEYGIASNLLAPSDFMILAQKSHQRVVPPDSSLLDYLPEEKKRS